jgi:hypothetical protein
MMRGSQEPINREVSCEVVVFSMIRCQLLDALLSKRRAIWLCETGLRISEAMQRGSGVPYLAQL